MAIVGAARPIGTACTGVDNRCRRHYRSTFEVETNDKTDGPPLILTTIGLPHIGDSYVWYNSFDDFSYVDSYGEITYRDPSKTQRLWRVPVVYKAPTSEASGASRPLNSFGHLINDFADPRNEPWEVWGSFQQFQKPVTSDKDWARLANVNDEPYVPAIEKEDCHDTLCLKKNTAFISLGTRSDLVNKVNSSTMWGLAARQIKLAQWHWRLLYFGQNIPYIENVLEFKVSYQKDDTSAVVGWKDIVLHQGFREVVDSAQTDPKKRYRQIMFRDMPITKPALLASDGTLLANAATPYYQKWSIEPERNFITTLGLPVTLPGGSAIQP